MVWSFLRPWMKALRDEGHDVEVACARGRHFDLLAREGYRMWEVPVARRFNPLANLRAFWMLYCLIRQGGFTVINTHSPVASAIGRLAAWLAGARNIVYTVHGFYFHDGTPKAARGVMIAIEWLLGRITSSFMFVSEEDRLTALRTGIARDESATSTINNGVDMTRFRPRETAETAGQRRIVGIAGRIVKEKGYREFLAMAKEVASQRDDVDFMVVGDCLPSDRDQFGEEFKRRAQEAGMAPRIHFTGHTSEVEKYLRQMNIFVLPSYREGFPVSVLEAMATGLPVVASAIRGCREAVAHGETGLLVEPRNARALTESVLFLLDSPDFAARMGEAGRRRAVKLYEESVVAGRYAEALREATRRGAGLMAARETRFERTMARAFDVVTCALALVALSPALAAVAILVRLKMGGPVIFRHTRPGLGGRPFVVYKFRTMSDARGPDGKLLPDAMRMNALGDLLRALSLDELPQLFNVLKGDMGLVGPRPLMMRYLPRYSARQMRRHDVRPGITGWAQVHGRNSIGWDEKFELDVWYVEHWSFWLDLQILALTVRKVIRREGITEDGQTTSSEFLGSSREERDGLVAMSRPGGD